MRTHVDPAGAYRADMLQPRALQGARWLVVTAFAGHRPGLLERAVQLAQEVRARLQGLQAAAVPGSARRGPR
jgi:hypothetical protein